MKLEENERGTKSYFCPRDEQNVSSQCKQYFNKSIFELKRAVINDSNNKQTRLNEQSDSHSCCFDRLFTIHRQQVIKH